MWYKQDSTRRATSWGKLMHGTPDPPLPLCELCASTPPKQGGPVRTVMRYFGTFDLGIPTNAFVCPVCDGPKVRTS